MRGMQLKFDEIYGEKIIPENDSVRMVEKIVSKKKSYFAISATGAEIVEKANSSAKAKDTTDGE